MRTDVLLAADSTLRAAGGAAKEATSVRPMS